MNEKSLKRKVKDLENYKKELKIMIKVMPLIGFKLIKTHEMAHLTGLSKAKCGRFLSDMGYGNRTFREGSKRMRVYYHPLSDQFAADKLRRAKNEAPI